MPEIAPIHLLIGLGLLLLFWVLYRSNVKRAEVAAAPRRRISYEAVTTPLARADAELKAKFPELASVATAGNVQLIRFGLFNWGDLPLEPEQVEHPVAVTFAPETEILSARLGETLKTELHLSEPLRVEGATVRFPPFGMSPYGTAIFNLIVRGDGRPQSVSGHIAGAPIRRLS